jgi:hypothetical protein
VLESGELVVWWFGGPVGILDILTKNKNKNGEFVWSLTKKNERSI